MVFGVPLFILTISMQNLVFICFIVYFYQNFSSKNLTVNLVFFVKLLIIGKKHDKNYKSNFLISDQSIDI